MPLAIVRSRSARPGGAVFILSVWILLDRGRPSLTLPAKSHAWPLAPGQGLLAVVVQVAQDDERIIEYRIPEHLHERFA